MGGAAGVGQRWRDLVALPKAHLHVHLESAIRWETVAELAAANGFVAPRPAGRRFGGFAEFAEHNGRVRDCLVRREDFARVALEFCEDEAAQGTRYAEVTFTAVSHGQRVGDLEAPLLGVLDGLAEGSARHGVRCRVLLDHPRRRSVERAELTLELADRYAPEVAGIGLAGDEAHPVLPFAGVMTRAVETGVRVVHHAGETRGPESIREAVGPGRAQRIGHGLSILEDPALLREVRARGITLEVCPSSNVALGLVPSIGEHPLPRLLGAGLGVAIGTDIPAVTGASLAGEFALLRDELDVDDATIAALNHAAVAASFAPSDVRAALRAGTDEWLETAAR